jgi:hypothetical protein
LAVIAATLVPLADPAPIHGVQAVAVPCLDRTERRITIRGPQTRKWFPSALDGNMVIDARSATWNAVADYPLRWGGGSDLCWLGGMVRGSYGDRETWSRMHDTKAMRVGQHGGERAVVDGFRAANYGDGISLEEGAEDFVIRGVHLVHMRDDCFENDFVHGGRIEDSLFEGCYVWIATRPRPSIAGSVNGAGRTIVIENNLAWMEPMPSVYSGPAPSTGAVFKVDPSSRAASPRMILRRNVVRVDVAPGVGDACLDPRGLVAESVGNIIVWLGAGDYPCLPIPAGWTLTRDQRVWDQAAADWKARNKDR